MEILKSELDQSVNFVEQQLEGFIESRYVRKCRDYFVCYLSSQNGCNKGCKFCHLTATKQTKFDDVNEEGYLRQAEEVFEHYHRELTAKVVHFSFMARGEPLDNWYLTNDGDAVLTLLMNLAFWNKLYAKFCISTIMPKGLNKALTDIFIYTSPTIYYSLYSMDEEWRKRWIPGAMHVDTALDMLKEYQRLSKKIIKIHFPFIRGENDSLENVADMCEALKRRNLLCEFNLVRYNPYSPEQGEESKINTILQNMEFMKTHFPGPIKEIPRVGYDVKASCGMFVQ